MGIYLSRPPATIIYRGGRYYCYRLLREAILNRTYGTNKNLHISLFLLTISGPVYYAPPKKYAPLQHIRGLYNTFAVALTAFFHTTFSHSFFLSSLRLVFSSTPCIVRGTIVNGTYGTHKKHNFRYFCQHYLVLFTIIVVPRSGRDSHTRGYMSRRSSPYV